MSAVTLTTLALALAYVGIGSLVALAAGRIIRAGTEHLDRPLPPESMRGGQTFGVKTRGVDV